MAHDTGVVTPRAYLTEAAVRHEISGTLFAQFMIMNFSLQLRHAIFVFGLAILLATTQAQAAFKSCEFGLGGTISNIELAEAIGSMPWADFEEGLVIEISKSVRSWKQSLANKLGLPAERIQGDLVRGRSLINHLNASQVDHGAIPLLLVRRGALVKILVIEELNWDAGYLEYRDPSYPGTKFTSSISGPHIGVSNMKVKGYEGLKESDGKVLGMIILRIK